jgi:hypothetical protein
VKRARVILGCIKVGEHCLHVLRLVSSVRFLCPYKCQVKTRSSLAV